MPGHLDQNANMVASSSHDFAFDLCDVPLIATASGALVWPAQNLLCVSDLHFGKAARYATQGGAALPPYETYDTLERLDAEIDRFRPKTIVCLGDSFDAPRSDLELDSTARDWILRLQAGRRWIWLEGNHDPGPVDLGGTHLAELNLGPLVFRHIARPAPDGPRPGEISGHFHPKATVHARAHCVTRKCFVLDASRVIMPAFGTYTGGLNVLAPPLDALVAPDAICVLTGTAARAVPKSALRP